MGAIAAAIGITLLVTAAGPSIPPALERQLAEGGLLVMPVGGYRDCQKLLLAEKRGGTLARSELLDVTFVPLIGREGFANNGRNSHEDIDP